jgi:NADH:ubiquinone reductase (H+-translocating)
VVIVGAGFAGLAAARALAKAAPDVECKVTLIDRHVYSTFQPLLYQVATGGLNPGDVAYPVRGFAVRHGVRYRQGTVVDVDADKRVVTLDDGSAVDFDYLVLAVGAHVNYFGVPGAAEHSAALYTRKEALTLRDEIMGALERAARAGPDGPGAAVVVVGGGPTGVEMAGTLAELRAALPVAFPEVRPTAVRVILAEQGDELLAPFRPELRAYALRELQRRGVEVRFSTTIAEVGEDFVRLHDGSTLPAQLTVWAAGVAVPDAVAAWGLPQGRGGRILVGHDLRVQHHDRVFAAGDLAMDPDHPLPQLAQPAIQTGRHAGRQIARLLTALPTQPFHYRDKGTMATIGRRAAIAQLPLGVRLTGTVAWLAWLTVHIVSLLGSRNRASTLLNLSWRYLYWPGGLIVGDIPEAEGG